MCSASSTSNKSQIVAFNFQKKEKNFYTISQAAVSRGTGVAGAGGRAHAAGRLLPQHPRGQGPPCLRYIDQPALDRTGSFTLKFPQGQDQKRLPAHLPACFSGASVGLLCTTSLPSGRCRPLIAFRRRSFTWSLPWQDLLPSVARLPGGSTAGAARPSTEEDRRRTDRLEAEKPQLKARLLQ